MCYKFIKHEENYQQYMLLYKINTLLNVLQTFCQYLETFRKILERCKGYENAESEHTRYVSVELISQTTLSYNVLWTIS